MSDLLLITGCSEPSAEVLPALGLLLHPVRVLPADASALVEAPPADAVLVDARRDLRAREELCRLLRTTGLDCPLFAIVTEGGLAAVTAEWGVDDVISAHRRARRGRGQGQARHRAPGHRRRGGRAGWRSAPATWPSTRRPTRPGCAAGSST